MSVENENAPEYRPPAAHVPDIKAPLEGAQFSLKTLFLTMTLFSLLFAVAAAFRLPPLQILAAFCSSALTALVTLGLVEFFGSVRDRGRGEYRLVRCRHCRRKLLLRETQDVCSTCQRRRGS